MRNVQKIIAAKGGLAAPKSQPIRLDMDCSGHTNHDETSGNKKVGTRRKALASRDERGNGSTE
jgi:hypothetical protein